MCGPLTFFIRSPCRRGRRKGKHCPRRPGTRDEQTGSWTVDLLGHQCLRIRLGDESLYHWEFERGDETVSLDVPGAITLNDTEVAMSLALRGAAPTYLPEPSVAGHLRSGGLRTVLDDWTPVGPAFHVYHSSRRQLPTGLRMLIELIRALRPLGLQREAPSRVGGGIVTFEPGARTAWRIQESLNGSPSPGSSTSPTSNTFPALPRLSPRRGDKPPCRVLQSRERVVCDLKKAIIMDKIFWIGIAALAGCLMPLQGALNAKLGSAVASPLHASLMSFAIGTAALGAYVVATRQAVFWPGIAAAPWYVWFGGLCGAFSLTAIILTYPRLGPGLAFGLIIAGQLLVAVLLEHFNILVAQPHPISLLRLAGVGLVLGGVVLIRTF